MIPIGSRIISGFIGGNLEKLNIILIFILKTPIRQFIMNRYPSSRQLKK